MTVEDEANTMEYITEKGRNYMRITSIISLGQQYLVLGMLVAFVFVFAGVVLKKKVSWKLLMKSVLVCYLVVVVGVTLLDRTGHMGTGKIMPLFYSYQDAWVNFSAAAWRNIILNICMFVPFGVLLPSCIKSCQSWWKTYLAGFVFTVGIESVQLVARRGLFELDDIMGNTVGAMIGYGIFALGICAWKMWKKKEKISLMWKKVMLLQLPLLITVLCFGCIFGTYQMQELGNLSGQCLIPYDAEKISIKKNVVLRQETTEAPVYQCNILSKEETVALANQVLSALGASVDETQNDFYDETAVLKAAERFSIWVEYEGGAYALTDFETSFSEESLKIKRNASEEELRKAFAAYGTVVPETAVLSWDEDMESYCFTVDHKISKTQWEKGKISGTYYENGCFSEIRNSVVVYETYKTFPIISEEEAYEKLEKGEFYYPTTDELEIQVVGCKLAYQTDSKGFYQPVYAFEMLINQMEQSIKIAAIAN